MHGLPAKLSFTWPASPMVPVGVVGVPGAVSVTVAVHWVD
jgi:hypothetical protein